MKLRIYLFALNMVIYIADKFH